MAKITDTALKRLAKLEAFPPAARRIGALPPRVDAWLRDAGPSLGREGHLHTEALHLRLHGIRAYAPNVSAYATIPVRARMWKNRIECVLEETGADRVNLIAHSMGGLDARYLITELGFYPNIASLITIATPHYGTGLADIFLEQPDRLRAWLTSLADQVGKASLEDATSDFRAAVADLRPTVVTETFNPSVPDHADVQYWSYGGQAGKGTSIPINPLMRLQNRMLFNREGINDGFVSVESARWGTFLGTIDADHTQQIGFEFPPRSRFRSDAFYLSLARMLGEHGL